MTVLTRNTQTFNLEADEYVSLRATSALATLTKMVLSVPQISVRSGAWSTVIQGPCVVVVAIASGSVDYTLGNFENDLQELIAPLLPNCLTLLDSTEASFVTQAAAAVAASRPLYMDRLVTLTTNALAIPDGLKMFSDWSGGFTGTGYCAPGDRIEAIGLLHQDCNIGWRWRTTSNTTNFTSIQEKFIRCATQAIADAGASGSLMHENIRMFNPYFEDCAYSMFLQRCRYSRFSNVKIRYSTANNTYRGIELNGGRYLLFDHLDVDGGRTGIVLGEQGTNDSLDNCEVYEPILRNISEESIGLDTRANEGGASANTALMDFFRLDGSDNGGTVASTTQLFFDWSAATIQTPATPPGSTIYANRDFIALNGNNRGKRYRISGAPSWTKLTTTARCNVTVPTADVAGFAAGDELAVVIAPIGVRITRPTIYLGTPLGGLGFQTGISCWGTGKDCEILQPKIYGGTNRNGLRLAHVSGILPRSGRLRITTDTAQLPVDNCQIVGAELYDCDVTLTNASYGTNLAEVTYRNPLRGTKLHGNAQIIVTNWKNSAGVEGANPAFDPAVIDPALA